MSESPDSEPSYSLVLQGGSAPSFHSPALKSASLWPNQSLKVAIAVEPAFTWIDFDLMAPPAGLHITL